MFERVDLDDRAIGLVGKAPADFIEIANCVQDFVNRISHPPIFMCRQAELFE